MYIGTNLHTYLPTLVYATGADFVNESEITATLNGISAAHQLLNSTYSSQSQPDTDHIILAPAIASIPSGVQLTASTVGVATACQPHQPSV